MEARSLTVSMPAGWKGAIAKVRQTAGGWGLIVALLILPVYYAIKDLTQGYQAGIAHGQPIIVHNLTQVGETVVQGSPTG